jgi:hypothetical protein
MLSFTVSKTDGEKIREIAKRAHALAVEADVADADFRMTMTMDLTACHANGCPLKLEELLAAEPFDFSHDVFGIRRHLNRETGELGGCFLPRFAAKG